MTVASCHGSSAAVTQELVGVARSTLRSAYAMGSSGHLLLWVLTLGRGNSALPISLRPCGTSIHLGRGIGQRPRSSRGSHSDKGIQDGPFSRGSHNPFGQNGRGSVPRCRTAELYCGAGAGGPLFRFRDKRPLTRQALVNEVHSALRHAGIDPTPYSGHSFRIRATTTAAAAGIEDAVIKILGRWRSNAYQAYIKLPRETGTTVTLYPLGHRAL